MKLFYFSMYGDWDNIINTLYVGNEYSPDPADMLLKIQAQFPIHEVRPSCTLLQMNSRLLNEEADIIKLLNRCGYTQFTPVTAILVKSLED